MFKNTACRLGFVEFYYSNYKDLRKYHINPLFRTPIGPWDFEKMTEMAELKGVIELNGVEIFINRVQLGILKMGDMGL